MLAPTLSLSDLKLICDEFDSHFYDERDASELFDFVSDFLESCDHRGVAWQVRRNRRRRAVDAVKNAHPFRKAEFSEIQEAHMVDLRKRMMGPDIFSSLGGSYNVKGGV